MCCRPRGRPSSRSGASLPPGSGPRFAFIPMTSLQRTLRSFISEGHYGWLFIVPSLLLAALFGVPVLNLVVRAIGSGFLASISSPSALQALRLSLVTSLTSLAVTVVFGTALAYLLARQEFRFKRWFEPLIDLPVVLPPSVAGLALLMAFGRNGLFGSLLGFFGISLPFTMS